ncbi:MAG TPA: hypothetical protein VFO48_06215, partial [Vicinamibacterales bacterium]|nr:hypothetical protein [Vicinamibacterales bacterium]
FVTVGLRHGQFTLEGSAFRGREPDEHRYNIETGALDSRAARLTWRPGGGFEFLDLTRLPAPAGIARGGESQTLERIDVVDADARESCVHRRDADGRPRVAHL